MWSGIVAVLAIAVASNLDNAGVGIAYGVRKIQISWWANGLIAVVSGLATFMSGWVGDEIAHYISAQTAAWIGAIAMILVGLWVMSDAWRKRTQPVAEPARNMVTRILRDPVEADFDKSFSISLLEALVLGVALAINSLVGGFDAGVFHMGILWTALLVALFSYLMLGISAWVGSRYAAQTLGDRATYIAGALLILVGIHQIW